MKLGWLSDIHLDHLEPADREAFLESLAETPLDAWLLGGDIDLAPSLTSTLQRIDAVLARPVYFTLGNHDFYGGSISSVRSEVARVAKASKWLTWLTDSAPIQLASGLVLVGDDSWADARFGHPLNSTVDLNDFYLIEELQDLSPAAKVRTLNALGDAAASRLAPRLRRALQDATHVIVLTHVPPFREATWHNGAISSDEWLPWFSCKVVGDVILECASSNPQREILVLCGHTHGAGRCSPAKNVQVVTAGVEYGAPRIQEVIEFRNSKLTSQ